MTTDVLTALGHLQDYADSSEKAGDELKSCMWQLTKSRRNVRSGILGIDSTTAYTAELLREELRAQIRVIDCNSNDENDEIDLVNEDASSSSPTTLADKDRFGSSSTASAATFPPRWKLCNVLSEMKKSKEPLSSKSRDSNAADPTESTGIRQRKNNDKTEAVAELDSIPSESWTLIQEEDLNNNDEEDENEKILQTDPLKLFGGYFTARELKVAQRKAQQALDGYIQAANEAAKLLTLLREKK